MREWAEVARLDVRVDSIGVFFDAQLSTAYVRHDRDEDGDADSPDCGNDLGNVDPGDFVLHLDRHLSDP